MICYNLNNRVILQSIYIIIRKSSCFATELYDAKIVNSLSETIGNTRLYSCNIEN